MIEHERLYDNQYDEEDDVSEEIQVHFKPFSLLTRLQGILGGVKDFEFLVHFGVVDDADVTQTCEVGGEVHLQTIGHSVL